jgi:biopolymer transport protein ExbD
MKKYFFALLFLVVFSCSSPSKVINLDVKENQLYIQNRRINIDDFDSEMKTLTRGLSKKELGDVTFSLTMDGKSKVGIVSDIKLKMENWKDSIK